MMLDIRKKKHSLNEWADFAAIFSRIEERPELPQSKRVERILGLLSRLGGNPRGTEAIRVVTELRNALSLYRWGSKVSPTPEGYRAVLMPAEMGDLSADDKWEYGAVRRLLNLTEVDGGLSRLRRCDEDERWFYAVKRSDQRFCSGTCRQHHYDSDEESRKKKRAYMRQLYADQKARARNPKSGVGLRRKSLC